MYQFKIKKQDDGGYKFELDGIKMLVDGYSVNDGTHLFTNPARAIAYFNIDDSIYSVSNDLLNFATAEAFYDAISKQYHIFSKGNIKSDPIIEMKPSMADPKNRKGNEGMQRSA